MIKTFILIIATHVNSSTVFTSIEFNSLEQCFYVKEQVSKVYAIEYINCFQK